MLSEIWAEHNKSRCLAEIYLPDSGSFEVIGEVAMHMFYCADNTSLNCISYNSL